MSRPDISTVPEFYHSYIQQVKEENLSIAFQNNTNEILNFLSTISVEKYNFSYAENKWTLKEVIQHIIDSERVFSYRALRFARKDATPLPGFDETVFAKNAKVDKRDWNDLVEELLTVRKATEFLFNSFGEEQLSEIGLANNNNISVLAIGFICVGHCKHHFQIIKERYL